MVLPSPIKQPIPKAYYRLHTPQSCANKNCVAGFATGRVKSGYFRPFPPGPTWGRSAERETHAAPVELRSLVLMAFRTSCCALPNEKRRNYWSSNQRILHGIGSIKAAHMALTGDHYRTLEAIKPLEPVINDSSQGPADLAQ